MTDRERVLVVDDDAAVRTVLGLLLEQDGLDTAEAGDGESALRELARGSVDVVVLDLRMPGMGGMALLAQAVERFPEVPAIVLTAHGSVPLAVEAMRLGALDFVEKPFERTAMLAVVHRALARARGASGPPPPATTGDRLMLGTSHPMRLVRDAVRRAGPTDATVLIRGENGTGKELVAQAIHAASKRSTGPFIKVNCAALSESLIESELFGYEKGAFTGAAKSKPGRIELAHGGTLFLDEVGEYSAAIQVKLLRVLQERQLERVGSSETLDVDVRYVAATNRNLEAAVAAGKFRQDLFFRLNVLPVDVPALRERREDIPDLAEHFGARLAEAAARAVSFAPEALALLAEQPWPGNVRQLENFVERLVVFTDHDRIERSDVERELARDAARALPAEAADPAPAPTGMLQARRDAERDAVAEALALAKNTRSLAARTLGISRRTLYNKLKELGLE